MFYRQGVRARRHLLVGWEANPSLVGRQVAVLRLHAALFWLRNDYTLLAERGERNAQLQYLLHFSLRTSENSVMAKFAEFLF
jgi:hypothetical protein